ncbi:hypothetical protein D3C76_805670 [compost metagenome]
MHAQERQLRVGDRVDQVVDDLALAGGQAVVLATEGDDLVVDLHPGQAGQTVGLQAGAGHQLAGLPGLLVVADLDVLAQFTDRPHGGRQPDFATGLADDLGHGIADLLVVDDAGGIEEQRTETGDVGFAALEFSGVEALDFQAIELRTLVQRLHALHFHGVGGDQQFAADVECDAVFGAEILGGLGAALAQLGLEAAGGVVDARVNHAAVVAGLVAAEAVFLLKDQQRSARALLKQRQGGGQSDDAAADDAVVVGHAGLPWCSCRWICLSGCQTK